LGSTQAWIILPLQGKAQYFSYFFAIGLKTGRHFFSTVQLFLREEQNTCRQIFYSGDFFLFLFCVVDKKEKIDCKLFKRVIPCQLPGTSRVERGSFFLKKPSEQRSVEGNGGRKADATPK